MGVRLHRKFRAGEYENYHRLKELLNLLSFENLVHASLFLFVFLGKILESCLEAKRLKASYRLGPELEICGYGCEDHFLESDTFTHCWESISELFERGATDGLLCDFGSIVIHNGTRYNCRILCRDRKVLLIRPKMALADNGNYRESRYFTGTSWNVKFLFMCCFILMHSLDFRIPFTIFCCFL